MMMPTRPLAATLPFNDPERDDQWFENVVRDLFRLSGYENVVFNGGPGDRQGGVDIFADRDGAHIGIQCKKEQQFGESDTDTAIAEGTGADRYILALSRRATVGVRRAIGKHENWTLADQVELSDMVRALPHDVAVTFIEQHFHPAHVETFLGRHRATAFLEREVFFGPWCNPEALLSHHWARVGAGPLESATAFIEDDARLLIVSGAIGSGRSKLLFDTTAGHLGGYHPYFLAAGADVTAASLSEIRAERSLVIVDDAQDVEHLAHVLSHVLARPHAKIILCVNAAQRSVVRDTAIANGFSPNAIREIRMERLGRDDTIALTRIVLGAEDLRIENAIVEHASDTPLSTILIARAIRDRRDEQITDDAHIRDLVRALYRDIALGNISDTVPRDDARAVLEVLAATGPARIESDEWLAATSAFLGWENPDRLLRALDAIDESGVLLRRGYHYSIAPAMLREALMLGACVAHGRSTTFPTRIAEHFPQRLRFLTNLAIADFQSLRDGGPALFGDVWTRAEAELRATYSLERAAFLDHAHELAYLRPRELLRLTRYLLTHPATNDAEQPFANLHVVGHDSVRHAVPQVLTAIMRGEPTLARECVPLLWQLARESDEPWYRHDPIRTILDLLEYDSQQGTAVATVIVETIEHMLAAGEPDSARTSLLELLAPVLSRDLTEHISTHTSLVIRQFVLNVESVSALRDRAIAVLEQAALGSDARRADDALKLLGELLPDPRNLSQIPSKETSAPWERERARVLDIYERIVDEARYPLRELRIADVLPWHARNHRSDMVRSRANALLTTLSGRQDNQRYRILIPGYVSFHSFYDLTGDAQKAQAALQEFVQEQTRDALRFTHPAELLEDLVPRMDAIGDAGLRASPLDLFWAIVAQHSAFGFSLLYCIVDSGNERFYPYLQPLIGTLFLENVTAAVAICERLLNSGNIAAATAVAASLGHRGANAGASANARTTLFARVLQHENLTVRLTAAFQLNFFARDYPECAVPLVIAARLDEDSKLADEVFMALPDAEPTNEQSEALLEKLRHVNELKYWPMHFMERIAPTHAPAIFELIRWRLTNGPTARAFHPVPYVVDPPMRTFLEALCNAPDFDASIRDFVGRYTDISPQRTFFFDTFMGQIASVAAGAIKPAIEQALNSDDERMHRASAGWMHSMPNVVLTSDIDFVVRVVERATRIGAEFANDFFAAVLNAIGSGAEAIAPYEAAPRDLRMQSVAAAALQHALSDEARRFFEELLEAGERSAQHSIRSSEDTFGPQ
jgi:hypothetical protein